VNIGLAATLKRQLATTTAVACLTVIGMVVAAGAFAAPASAYTGPGYPCWGVSLDNDVLHYGNICTSSPTGGQRPYRRTIGHAISDYTGVNEYSENYLPPLSGACFSDGCTANTGYWPEDPPYPVSQILWDGGPYTQDLYYMYLYQ
jgi:hypothetical protein